MQLTGQQFAPQDGIVMGDTVADTECARTAGAVAIAILTGFAQRQALSATPPDDLRPNLTHFLAHVPS